ncbi:hypothetical protein [Spiroplasma endosymbiont of Sarcophaga variegata]|uniref:hypothetical protein n=1 Tax=unclassified Spiroplasma TaxID=2637901 RepID=UPI003AF79A1C
MINLLSESNNWDNIFSFIFDVFLFIFDVIWNTKLPMTNTTIAYFIIFFMVVKLSIYAIHGTRTQYNELGSTVKNNTSKLYASTARGVKKAYKTNKKGQWKETD